MLFFNLTNSFHIHFLYLYFSSILLAKFFGHGSITDEAHHCCEVEVESEYRDKEEDWESAGDGSQSNLYEEDLGFITFDCSKTGDLVANTIHAAEVLLFSPIEIPQEQICCEQPPKEVLKENFSDCSTPRTTTEETISVEDADSVVTEADENGTQSSADADEHASVDDLDTYGGHMNDESENLEATEKNLEEDGHFFTISPHIKSENVKPIKNPTEEETLEDSFTVGSTSKSSSEWRNSTHYRGSVSEDPFSSSSRRSCPTWESYTAFQKYGEEMTFYDQISAQKLDETKLFKGVEVLPRSMSQKLVQRFTKRNKKPAEFQRNPHHELETAYVAQTCLAWEALSLSYKNFLRLRALQGEDDPGCPAYVVQQFQQFQVLLQRFIENEPYEHGRRPEVFARVRISLPKLLQVPEFRGVEKEENDPKDEGWITRISSIKLMRIMEDGIRTFMDFLKADKEKHYQIFKVFIRRNNRTSQVDPTLLHMLKKANRKKKKKIKDISGVRKCLRKARPRNDEMETLMGLIDLKVVSRVLKMSEITEEEVQWCEAKMSKLRFWEGKLERDPSPLLFPAHSLF